MNNRRTQVLPFDDDSQKKARRPQPMPKYVWAACALTVLCVLCVLGARLRRDPAVHVLPRVRLLCLPALIATTWLRDEHAA